MKKMKIAGLSIVGLLVVLTLVAFLLPRKWRVERSVVISAPAAEIIPFLANLKNGWPKWSDFDAEDPNIVYSFSGTDQGVGAERSWISKKMGNGSQKIVTADINKGVEFTLQMDNGFLLEGKFVFQNEGNDATKVTWTDTGDVGGNPLFRYMGLMMNGMMGPTFEKSLAALKKNVEATHVKN